MNDQTLLGMDDILSGSLDDTPDAPEFVNPPNGNYVLEIPSVKVEEYETTDGTDKVKKIRIRINYKVAETIELADEGEDRVPDGSLFSETFMTNPDGLSYFKRQAKNVLGADNIAGVPLKDILKEMGGKSIKAQVRSKESKQGNKTYINTQVRILSVI